MAPADDMSRAWQRGFALIKSALTRFDINTKTQLTDAYRGLFDYTRQWIVREVPAAYIKGRSGARGLPQIEPETPERGAAKEAVHSASVNELGVDLDKRMIDNLLASGRKVNDLYRTLVDEGLRRGLFKGSSLAEMREDIAGRIRREGLGGYVDSSGREWTPDAYASMAARTTLNEAHNLGLMNELEMEGYDLVEIPDRATSCPICSRYEGRIYSITGSDPRYPALRGTAFGVAHSTIHPNCQHELLPYYEELAVDPRGDRRRSNAPFVGAE